ncbi:hypothetical protein MCA1445 [Methylococcus capsulatus str. Bath]|uniref:Uncharacterized protein n=1 Tax=Methylococcus capsulatus (strain ATCC 33009 / NCIMB 11132 / Bath) TaxID=243233 RepID=Q608P5_METCA|nr:hypothetical protein MCA1445 [Methylococcus capsulatus str. Bath]
MLYVWSSRERAGYSSAASIRTAPLLRNRVFPETAAVRRLVSLISERQAGPSALAWNQPDRTGFDPLALYDHVFHMAAEAAVVAAFAAFLADQLARTFALFDMPAIALGFTEYPGVLFEVVVVGCGGFGFRSRRAFLGRERIAHQVAIDVFRGEDAALKQRDQHQEKTGIEFQACVDHK